MMYYRLALQERQATTWAWKSTLYVPYMFTLPLSIPQVRAWTQLLSKVQAGKLQS